ncbi:MAG: hypothetical protein HQL54_11215, partial [Magnetococcales bacterium]|nr:hypothetical protein [Magnetococcales bacterium]
MNITLDIEVPDEVGEQLRALPNLSQIASELLQNFSQQEERPLSDLEKEFILKSREDARNG